MNPPASAMPLRIAPMPCSRMPKWKLRPANASRATAGESAMRVRVEGSRSALPPASAGTSAAARCSTTLPWARVAAAPRGASAISRSKRSAGTRVPSWSSQRAASSGWRPRQAFIPACHAS